MTSKSWLKSQPLDIEETYTGSKSPMNNKQIAKVFEDIADLLELKGATFWARILKWR